MTLNHVEEVPSKNLGILTFNYTFSNDDGIQLV